MIGTRTTAGIQVTLKFMLERETKGAVRFTEVQDSTLDEPTVGTLYVRKYALRRMGYTEVPKSLTMTLEI